MISWFTCHNQTTHVQLLFITDYANYVQSLDLYVYFIFDVYIYLCVCTTKMTHVLLHSYAMTNKDILFCSQKHTETRQLWLPARMNNSFLKNKCFFIWIFIYVSILTNNNYSLNQPYDSFNFAAHIVL